jgi:hypothetical protein
VVIHQINIERVTVNEAEDNPPVAGYRSAPRALQVALESVETIARQVEVGRALRCIQMTQNVSDPARLISANLAGIPLLEQAFQTPVPESAYHQNTVPCIGTDIKEKYSVLR